MRCAICTKLYGESGSDTEECEICEDTSTDLENLIGVMLEKSSDYEFSTFSLGTKIYEEIEKREGEMGVEGRFKREINEILRDSFERASGKDYVMENGELYLLVDTRFDWVTVSSKPVFIYGRYNKLSRELPQTRKTCTKCLGHGCYHCNGKGKLFDSSVEEGIGTVAVAKFRAKDTKFHGMGREDIDVRMLGSGRPFVIELVEPRIRSADLDALEREINMSERIKVSGLRYSDFDEVVRIKSAKLDKVYIADVSFGEDVPRERLETALTRLEGAEVRQRTPVRVLQRRSDLVRIRRIKGAELVSYSGKNAEIRIEAESGTYIKELIHGDKGRTVPSLASLLGCECGVEALDVIEVREEA